MRRSETALWKSKSSRNRHNGRINAITRQLINNKDTKRFQDAAGKIYFALLQMYNQTIGDETVQLTKSRIVRQR